MNPMKILFPIPYPLSQNNFLPMQKQFGKFFWNFLKCKILFSTRARKTFFGASTMQIDVCRAKE
jgi:hypothetical protein